MDISTVQKYLKEIVDGMYRHFNYTIEDLSFIENIGYQWGISKVNEQGIKKYLIFTTVNKGIINENFETHLCSKLNCDRENLIKVIIVSERNESKEVQNRLSYLNSINAMEDNLIILDLAAKSVHISNNRLEEEASQVGRIMSSYARMRDSSNKAYITYGLIAINIIIFIISALISGDFMDIDVYTLVDLGAKYNPFILQGEWYRLFTCMFLHGGLMHIAVNMYSLYALGPFVEQLHGKYKYVFIYFTSGITASLFSFWFSTGLSVGASGAIAGLLGAIFVFAIKERKRIGSGLLMNVVSNLVLNIYIGISMPNIDNYAHLGGLLGGMVLAIILSMNKRTQQ